MNSARRLNVERLFVLGDVVGYYYWPAECLALIERWPFDMVRGNHEDMLAKARHHPDTRPRIAAKYGSGINVALERLPEETIDRLAALPRRLNVAVQDKSALLCHGSPWSTDTYVYPDADESTRRAMADTASDAVFFGHSHYPLIWHIDGIAIANPGSVGQPRNRQPGAHWLIWDSASNAFEARCESYDVGFVCRICESRDPDLPYLSQVLTRTSDASA